jgi:hypothetical protein
MRILIGALFILLASAASAHARWSVKTGATGVTSALVETRRAGVTYQVGLYCYDSQTPFIYFSGFPPGQGGVMTAEVIIDDARWYRVDTQLQGYVPQGPAIAPMVRELIVGLEMQVRLNSETINFTLIGSARSLRNALRNCFVE